MTRTLAVVAVALLAAACAPASAQEAEPPVATTTTAPPPLHATLSCARVVSQARPICDAVESASDAIEALEAELARLTSAVEDAGDNWPELCKTAVMARRYLSDTEPKELRTRTSNDVWQCEGKPDLWLNWWDKTHAVCDHDWHDPASYTASEWTGVAEYLAAHPDVTQSCYDADKDRDGRDSRHGGHLALQGRRLGCAAPQPRPGPLLTRLTGAPQGRSAVAIARAAARGRWWVEPIGT